LNRIIGGILWSFGLSPVKQKDKRKWPFQADRHRTDNRRLTGTGLVHLQGLPLKCVFVTGPGVTDDGLKPLGAFRELTIVGIGDGRTALAAGETYRVTDVGLTHLARLPKLQSALIDGTAITGQGVLALKQPSLKHVRCERCPRLTRRAVKRWHAAAPQINVEWS
jgi:hypothetical protein